MKRVSGKRHPAGRGKRFFAFLMSLCLIGTMVPIPTRAEGDSGSAATGLCEHHTAHTAECGYAEPVAGQECGHIHDENCGYQAASECTHVHTEECGEDGASCIHVHTAECGYAEEHACEHVHDEACGYVEVSEGSPCTFVCDICQEEPGAGEEGETEENENTLSPEAQAVQALIDALPDAENITEENFYEVADQLDEIDTARGALTEEERKALDFTRYDAAVAKMLELMGQAEDEVAVQALDFTATGKPVDTEVRTINLNARVLRPDGKWSAGGNKVYFGNYGGTATAYRVLSAPSTQTNAASYLLLDCDTVLISRAFNKADAVHQWKDSDLEGWLNGDTFYKNGTVFSDIEKAAIIQTTLAEQEEYKVDTGSITWIDDHAEDYVFCLSAAESDGLYTDITPSQAKEGANTWWLRSISGNKSNDNAGIVYPARNYIEEHSVFSDTDGVSPAFNLNPASILLASVSDQGTSGKSAALAQVSASSAVEWKLTLLDSSKTVTIQENESVTREESNGSTTVTVPYTYTDNNTTNPVTQISVMLTDKAYTDSTAQVLYYGALQNTTITAGGTAGTGTGTFLLPSELAGKTCGTDYYVYLIAENVNGDKASDYASTPFAITIPEGPKPAVTDNPGNSSDSGSTGSTNAPAPTPSSISYQILDGANGIWTLGSGEELTIRGNGAFSKFTGVRVDGTPVDQSSYTAKEGSTIITFKTEYLNTLSPGTHSFEIVWTDGTAATNFVIQTNSSDNSGNIDSSSVSSNSNSNSNSDSADSTAAGTKEKKDDVPKTGENTPIVWLFALVAASGTGLVFTEEKNKKDAENLRK